MVLALMLSCKNFEKEPNSYYSKLWSESDRTFLIEELERTKGELLFEIQDLKNSQWEFRTNENSWSIAEIVEHLEIQDEMFFREMDVIPNRPETPEFVEVVKGNDSLLLAYATDPTKGNAGYLEPIGRFCSKDEARSAFIRIRKMILNIVSTTDEDLRQHFTFRNYQDDGGLTNPGIYDVRDLHQLMLTCIAHTDRHIHQIIQVKMHSDYPGK
jgi:hypothetical protein